MYRCASLQLGDEIDRSPRRGNWVPMAPDRVAKLPNSIVALRQRAPQLKICNWVAKLSKLSAIVGKNGIRTRGVGWLPNALAKRRLKPLSHLSNLEFYDLQLSPRRGNWVPMAPDRVAKLPNSIIKFLGLFILVNSFRGAAETKSFSTSMHYYHRAFWLKREASFGAAPR